MKRTICHFTPTLPPPPRAAEDVREVVAALRTRSPATAYGAKRVLTFLVEGQADLQRPNEAPLVNPPHQGGRLIRALNKPMSE